MGPKQRGNDLTEQDDTFWHLRQFADSNSDFSGVIINIGDGTISFSTRSYFVSIPFEYMLKGLEFYPIWESGRDPKNCQYSKDLLTAKVFEGDLHRIHSYGFKEGILTFSDKNGHPLMALAAIEPAGIENRRWRIAKFRGGAATHVDGDGLTDAKSLAEISFVT